MIRPLRAHKDFLLCPECGQKATLPDVEKPLALAARDRQSVDRTEAIASLRRTYEMHLSRIKGFRRDRLSPRCFISHLAEQTALVNQLISDMREAGVYIVEDCTQVQADDFIILVKTPIYQQSWKRFDDSLAEDVALVQTRLHQTL